MVTRAQEHLAIRFSASPAARQAQHAYFRAVCRRLTDEICATVPVALGHSQPAYSSTCVLITAYNSIWPLFFAGTCILERIGQANCNSGHGSSPASSAAMAQLAWILGRFDYITNELGIRWADGVAATLRGDFKIHDDIMPSPTPQEISVQSPELQRLLVDEPSKPAWILDIEQSGGGPRAMIEGDRRLLKGPGGLMADQKGPNWLGRHVDVEDEPTLRMRAAYATLTIFTFSTLLSCRLSPVPRSSPASTAWSEIMYLYYYHHCGPSPRSLQAIHVGNSGPHSESEGEPLCVYTCVGEPGHGQAYRLFHTCRPASLSLLSVVQTSQVP